MRGVVTFHEASHVLDIVDIIRMNEWLDIKDDMEIEARQRQEKELASARRRR